MMAPRDVLAQSLEAVRLHKLRAFLTVLGLTIGVATLIAVMTLIQGANRYVETKVANLGTNVFQVARTPITVTDFDMIQRALKHRKFEIEAVAHLAGHCRHCELVGASGSTTGRARFLDQELRDISIIGHTPNMYSIDTRTVELGRYFTETEEARSSPVCLIGDTVRQQLFPALDPLGRTIHIANVDCLVIGALEKIGSILGQDQDKFVIVPMNVFLAINGRRSSLTLNVKTAGGPGFQLAQDEARIALRALRHVAPKADDDFFIATKESYISLWQSISTAFFAVFIMVSAISAIVGGVVIMNVMLVSVTERTKEIGIRRAVGATQRDIARQFLTESVVQCLAGGVVGIAAGFLFAWAIREATAFPTEVEAWVVATGMGLSTAIGMFFGIYPAMRAARLDPVVALRSD
ncbi:MAG: ABC transporter permease [Bryobacteraceae bacterium]|nr:ABC transporter permease [Bryobacteraceae bacterium]